METKKNAISTIKFAIRDALISNYHKGFDVEILSEEVFKSITENDVKWAMKLITEDENTQNQNG